MVAALWKRSIRRYATWFVRAFWVVLFAGHANAWISAVAGIGAGDGGGAARAVFLTVAQAFFVLKICNVPWLRLPAGRSALVRFAVAIALLHAGVVQRALNDTGSATTIDPLAAVLVVGGSALLLTVSERVSIRLRASVAHALVAALHAARRRFAIALEAVLRPLLILPLRSSAPHRAPPLLS